MSHLISIHHSWTNERALTPEQTSPASKTIPLPALTQIEPHPKLDNCLLVEFTTRPSSARTELVSIVFKSNPELYTWRDALYLRSALSSPIGNPTNLVHHVHVGVDPNGTFTVCLFLLAPLPVLPIVTSIPFPANCIKQSLCPLRLVHFDDHISPPDHCLLTPFCPDLFFLLFRACQLIGKAR